MPYVCDDCSNADPCCAAEFQSLQSAEGTITPGQLHRVAKELPGLHEGELSGEDWIALDDAMQAACDGAADLVTIFSLFREHQKAKSTAPTARQLTKGFLAFDTSAKGAGSMPADRVKAVVKLFDGPALKSEVLKAAKAEFDGGDGDMTAKDLAKAQKSSTDLDIHKLVEAYDEYLKNLPAPKEQKKPKADRKDDDKAGGFFGWLHRGEKKVETKEKEADSTTETGAVAEVAADEVAVTEERGWFGGLFGGQKDKAAAPAPAPASTLAPAPAPAPAVFEPSQGTMQVL